MIRQIKSGKIYEICCRARQGLPLPPNRTMKAIVKGIMARTQRDQKVTICQFLWMSNHLHILIITKDANDCVKFYTEVQKKITDALKRLLGLSYLHLWEGTPMVALIPDVFTIKDRIAYMYTNPSEADLEVSIERYPGLSSWNEFLQAQDNVDSLFTSSSPWIREKALEKLPSPSLSEKQDEFFSNKFIKLSKKTHDLVLEPNAWMKCFNIKDPLEVKAINQSIIDDIRAREQQSILRRAVTGKGVIGAHRLIHEPILKAHTPKKKSKRIFVICCDKDLRIACIKERQAFQQERNERLEQWRAGDFTSPWPPGAFRPPMPPLANAVEFKQHSFF